VAYAAASLVLLCRAALIAPMMLGDGREYYYQVETLYSHGTPEIRQADFVNANANSGRCGFGTEAEHPYAFFPALNGQKYPLHFFAYAASAVPFRAALAVFGSEQMTCLQLANVWWALFGLGSVLLFGAGSVWRRLTFAALVAVGPAYGYWQYTGAELYTYGLLTAGLVAIGNRRYALAALLVSAASLQNSPAALVAGVAVLMAMARGRWRETALAILACVVSLVPFFYYKSTFGIWNLLAGFTDTGLVSWNRTWSQVADLNQGLLPYVPFLVILPAAALVRLARARDLDALLVAAALAGMAVATQTHINWNSAAIGVQRYLLWFTPILAWLAVRGLWPTRWGKAALVLAVVAHAVLMEVNPGRADGKHTPLAQWVLNNHPALYWPEPELFVERTNIRDGAIIENGVLVYHILPDSPPALPFGYVGPDGSVTKLLVDAASVERLPERYLVTPEYLAEARARVAGRTGMLYLHPPPGAVRAKKEGPIP
jgi:hypothetical protein